MKNSDFFWGFLKKPPYSTATEFASSASSLSVSTRKCFPGMGLPKENSRGSINMTPLKDTIAETEKNNQYINGEKLLPFKVKLTHILSAILCHDLSNNYVSLGTIWQSKQCIFHRNLNNLGSLVVWCFARLTWFYVVWLWLVISIQFQHIANDPIR